ncbi:MAG: FtsW/RodA/SpoVE family cell cycle protein [Oscillospiraceae bacterium]|jgi:cell division protein FtsW|nr:FtsW/RodA/SpoVE family cell cycle protein [Oscillospiraceae bacterium]
MSTKTATKPIVRPRRVKKPREKRELEPFQKMDYTYFVLVLVLLGFGLTMLYSASFPQALSKFGDSLHFIKPQLLFAGAGIVIALVVSLLPRALYGNKTLIAVYTLFCFVLMLYARFKPVNQGGADRWVTMFGVTFQPSEFLKVAVILCIAYISTIDYDEYKLKPHAEQKSAVLNALMFFESGKSMTSRSTLVRVVLWLPTVVCKFFGMYTLNCVILGLACIVTIAQPHLSGTIIIFLVGTIMGFVAESKKRRVFAQVLVFAVGGLLAIALVKPEYMSVRFQNMTDVESDITGATFQTYQSLIAIGSGGFSGVGFGESHQKYAYIPAAHNDFLFSVIVEELGFIGGVVMITLFAVMVVRGINIAVRNTNRYSSLLVFGITMQLGIQALLNIAVVSNSFPNTGISLPFMSYGGTALIIQMIEVGLVLAVSRRSQLK